MDEETTVQTEQQDVDETSKAFDEGWDDLDAPVIPDDGQDDWGDESDEPETAEESEGTEADADQQEADENDGGEADDSQEAEGEGDKGSPDQGQLFTLKHLKEEKTVDRNEVIALAQQGLDYPRIREKWDGVKDDLPRLRMYEDFLGRLAKPRLKDGVDLKAAIESLIDETNTRTLISEAEANGEELSPAAAASQAVRMRTQFAYEAPAPDPVDEEQLRQERSQRETTRFMKEYPTVQATEIPKEVWDDVNDPEGADGDLVGAYRAWENKKLKDEVKQLKKQLEDKEQKDKNKKRSTGSTKSVGSSARRNAFDEGWDFES